jgi:hypothetical protein
MDAEHLYSVLTTISGSWGATKNRRVLLWKIGKASGLGELLHELPCEHIPQITVSGGRVGWLAHDQIGVYGQWQQAIQHASFSIPFPYEFEGRKGLQNEDHLVSDNENLYRVRLTCVPDNPLGGWVPPELLVERYAIADGARTVRQFPLVGLGAFCKVDDVVLADGAIFVLICPRLPTTATDGETILVKIT